MFFFDSYYFILVIPAIVISLFAQMAVQSAFSKYSKVRTAKGITGAEAAREVLDRSGVQEIKIVRVAGKLTDHFDPRTNTISLSDSVYGSATVAAAGVAAHEAGHAVQYAEEYSPMKLRAAIIPVTRFGSMLAWPLILISFFIESVYSDLLFAIGAILFASVLVFQLVTLPVELNASRRALAALEGSNMLEKSEMPGARKVLRAAAMTYLAALIVTVAQLARILLMRNRRR